MVKLFFFYICLPNHDDDDRQCGDVGGENVDIVDLCLRSLIDPGRWRAPARSSWSPFFINNSETTKAPKIHPSSQKSWLFKDVSGDITPGSGPLSRFPQTKWSVLKRWVLVRDWALEAIFKTEARDPLNARSLLRSIDFKDDRSETSSAGCTCLYLERRSFLSVISPTKNKYQEIITCTPWPVCGSQPPQVFAFLRPVLNCVSPNNI